MGVRSLRLFRYPRLNQSYTERETARASLLSFSFSAATRRSGNRVKTSNNEMAFLSRPPGTRQAHYKPFSLNRLELEQVLLYINKRSTDLSIGNQGEIRFSL